MKWNRIIPNRRGLYALVSNWKVAWFYFVRGLREAFWRWYD